MSGNRNAPILKAHTVDLPLALPARLSTSKKPRFDLLLVSAEGFRRNDGKTPQIQASSDQGL